MCSTTPQTLMITIRYTCILLLAYYTSVIHILKYIYVHTYIPHHMYTAYIIRLIVIYLDLNND